MRSTQYYGQTRRFVVVDTTPKTVRVREIRRWGLDDLAVKRVREDGTFTLGRWQARTRRISSGSRHGDLRGDLRGGTAGVVDAG